MRRRTRLPFAAVALAFLLALAGPGTAPAQDTGAGAPSAQELWRDYPLNQRPVATTAAVKTAAATPGGRTTDTAATVAAASTTDDGPISQTLSGALAALLSLAIAAGVIRRIRHPAGAPAERERVAAEPRQSHAGAPAAAQEAAPAPRRASRFRRTAGATAPALAPAGAGAGIATVEAEPAARAAGAPMARRPSRSGAVAPPDVDRRWKAQIEWRAEDGPARFRVLARPEGGRTQVLVESPPVAWPPGDEDEVQAVTDAVLRLEARLLEAGWTALEPDRDSWFARRFAWTPDGGPA